MYIAEWLIQKARTTTTTTTTIVFLVPHGFEKERFQQLASSQGRENRRPTSSMLWDKSHIYLHRSEILVP